MSSPMRLSGLATGMDTETLVKQLMNARRQPLNRLLQQKQTLDWQRDQYRETSDSLASFRSSMEKLRLQSTFEQSTAKSSDENYVVATRVSTTTLDNYEISDVVIGSPAKAASVKFTSPTYDSNIDTLTGALDLSIKKQDGSSSEVISVAAGKTVQEALDAINAKSDITGVKAVFFADDKSITFLSTTAGASANVDLTVTNDGGFGIASGKVDSSTSTFGTGTAIQSAALQPSTAKINGMTYTSNSSTFVFDGVKFELKQNTPVGAKVGVAVAKDTDAIYEDIKSFVDAYNDTIKSLNSEIREKRYRDFTPLLDEQKKEMKEKEIELWESKAKSGLLKNDSLVSEALYKMRKSLYSKVDGVTNDDFDTLSEIGIKTSEDYKDYGKLIIDEDKLRGFIETNLEDVKALFTKSFDTGTVTHTTANNETKYKNSGLARRIYDQLNSTVAKIKDKAGTSDYTTDTTSLIGKQLIKLDKRIGDMESRMGDIEQRYWNQFSKLESMSNQYNAQSSWLSGMLGYGQ